MKRRKFIQTGSMMSLPFMLGGVELTAMSSRSLASLFQNENDRSLVLIRLAGGNDGLNMVIPLDQYAGLSAARPTLLLPESSVLKLVDNLGVHPVMSGLRDMYKEEKLAIVQSVSYPNQNRSHFRSTDIWSSASDSNKYIDSGWVGRYLSNDHPSFPEGYPNSTYSDPLAISIGNVVSDTCQGRISNFSFTLANEASVRLVEQTVQAPHDNTCYGDELDFIRTTIDQSNKYATRVIEAFANGKNLVEYPNNNLSNQLKSVAKLISGGLQSKIYVVTLGGFDTHANQVLIGESGEGNHANLLRQLSDAINLFSQDLNASGNGERVVGMTFSEFGRQIKANNSYGTDHGTAAPMIVFGNCVRQGIIGQNPEISTDLSPQEGVPMQYDFRSIYATLLIDWLEADPNVVKSVLYRDYQKLSLIENCESSPSSTDNNETIELSISPNPCHDQASLTIHNDGERIHVSLMDVIGSRLQVVLDRRLIHGEHAIPLDLSTYKPGTYFVRVLIDNRVKTIKLIKV